MVFIYGWASLTWDDGCIKFRNIQLGQISHVTPGDAGAFLQDVSFLLCRLPLTVIYNMHLIFIWSKHLHL